MASDYAEFNQQPVPVPGPVAIPGRKQEQVRMVRGALTDMTARRTVKTPGFGAEHKPPGGG